MLIPITSSQYRKDFKRIVQSPKFNHSEYLVVCSVELAGAAGVVFETTTLQGIFSAAKLRNCLRW